jgi:phosphohistidine phosphatase
MPLTHLYVLRHGIAVPHGTPGVPEADRPLTSKGESQVEEVAKGLKRLDLGLDRVVTSPLPRARRTAEIVAEELGLEDRLENDDALRAGASPRSIRDWLAGRPEQRLMIVGHNPDLTDLVGLLVGLSSGPPPFDLKKAGVAALRASEGGGYRLHWFATPRLIRELIG